MPTKLELKILGILFLIPPYFSALFKISIVQKFIVLHYQGMLTSIFNFKCLIQANTDKTNTE